MPRPSLCLNIPKTGFRFTRRFFDAADRLELRRRCGLGRLAAPNRASVEIVKRIKRYGPGWGNLNSPEVLAGRPAEDADDVWSLCVVLAEIVAGRQPFAGGAPEAVLRRIRGQRLAAGAPPSAVLAFATAILTAPPGGTAGERAHLRRRAGRGLRDRVAELFSTRLVRFSPATRL